MAIRGLIRSYIVQTVRHDTQKSKDRAARRAGLISARQQRKQRKAARRAAKGD